MTYDYNQLLLLNDSQIENMYTVRERVFGLAVHLRPRVILSCTCTVVGFA